MRIVDVDRFLADRRRYALAHTCEVCVHHDERRDACAHGYPDALHRARAFDGAEPSTGTFCKEFEVV